MRKIVLQFKEYDDAGGVLDAREILDDGSIRTRSEIM
jgi:hypothetical protein